MPGKNNDASKNKEETMRDIVVLRGIRRRHNKSDGAKPKFITTGVAEEHRGLNSSADVPTVLPDINYIVTIRYVARSTGIAWLQAGLAERNPDSSLRNLLLGIS